MISRISSMWRASLIVPVLFLALGRACEASPELQAKLAAMAKNIVDNTKNQSITVGQFSPTGLPFSNSGPGIEQQLTAELERIQKGIVQESARFEVKGDFAFVKSKANPDLKEVKITARLIEKESGDELKDLSVTASIADNKDIGGIVQPTVTLPPDGSREERNKKIDDAAKKPAVHIQGSGNTLISSSDKSEFAVEILVKPLKDHETQVAKPRGAKEEKGQAFVAIDKDELFEVRLHNNSKSLAAVTLSIDGIDMFHFSKDRNAQGQPRFSHTIIAPGATETLVGWHNALEGKENYLSFLVTAYGQGAITKAGLPSRGNVGVIHVQFARCDKLEEGGKGRSGNEVGFGPPREIKQKAVQVDIEPPHDFVSVRYQR